MVRITLGDERNALVLSEGYVPSLSSLTSVYPGRGPYQKDSAFIPSKQDEAIAWVLTAYARRVARHHGYSERVVGGMETWLIGPSEDKSGSLQEWFVDVKNPSYRVMLHRSPKPHNHRPPGEAWNQVYKQLGIRHRTGTFAHLKQGGRECLVKMLQAYRRTPPQPGDAMSELGHPATYSAGLVI